MKRASLFALAFALMMGAAVASMVRFGGHREPAPQPAVMREVTPALVDRALILPVTGVRWTDVRDTWGQARGGGTRGHAGTDIMAPRGVPVVAAAAGRIEKLFDSEAGGRTLYVRSPDRRWSYYYAHLAEYYPGVAEGQVVRAGQQLGFVGDTGNAGAGNYHLHFGISRMQPQDGWWQGTPVNPYPLLAARRATR